MKKMNLKDKTKLKEPYIMPKSHLKKKPKRVSKKLILR
jgi:hypothetical protein